MAGDNRTLGLPDGRTLGFAHYGAPDGHPLLAFHGVPGTRLMWRGAGDAAARQGFRLIAPDRPGFGLSTPSPGRTLADWVDDVRAMTDFLAVDRFAVAGISGGGPFATATAAAFPDRVTALALISPMGPIGNLRNAVPIDFTDRLFFLRLPKRPRLMSGLFGLMNGAFRRAPAFYYDLFVRTLPAADREILREPHLKQQVLEDVSESLTHDGEGMRADVRIFSEPWHVDFAAIAAPSVLWQGTDDTIVPVNVALGLGNLIPGCEVHRIPHAGHFWVYRNFEPILARIAALRGRTT